MLRLRTVPEASSTTATEVRLGWRPLTKAENVLPRRDPLLVWGCMPKSAGVHKSLHAAGTACACMLCCHFSYLDTEDLLPASLPAMSTSVDAAPLAILRVLFGGEGSGLRGLRCSSAAAAKEVLPGVADCVPRSHAPVSW